MAIIDFNMWKTVPDSWTITIKQIVRLQGGIYLDKFQLDKISNERLAAIIDFSMRNIGKTVPDRYTIYIITKCIVSGRDMT